MNDFTQSASPLQSGSVDPSLGSISTLPSTGQPRHKSPSLDFQRQHTAAKLLPDEQVCHCFRHISPKNPDRLVEMRYTPSTMSGMLGRGSLGGLQCCGSVWHCPVCGGRITRERREEIRKLVDKGYNIHMISLTLRHHNGDRLGDLRGKLNKAFELFKGGRRWQKFCSEWGIVGTIKANEVTISRANGWHPHLHVVVAVPTNQTQGKLITDLDLNWEFIEQVKSRWLHVLSLVGADADWEHGAEVTINKDNGEDLLNKYFCKWGLEGELAGKDQKEGRDKSYSMNDLLDLAADGDQWAADRWREYAMTYKGTKQLHWSRGLQALAEVEDQDDEEIAEQASDNPDTVVVGVLAYDDGWQQILYKNLREKLIERLTLTAGNADLLWEWLNGHGIKRVEPERVDLRDW